MTTYSIIVTHNDRDLDSNIIKNLGSDAPVFLFVKDGIVLKEFESKNVTIVSVPKEFDTNSKLKNYVSKYFKDNGTKGFLCVFEDLVKVDADAFPKFVPAIEEMMTKLGQTIWFNTTTDPCNRIFTKFDPRVKIFIDNEKYKNIYNKQILWCSHANTSMIFYDLDKVSLDEMLFDESFSIAMFYIIKFHAERRNAGKTFMNMYPTIAEELNVITTENINETPFTPETMKKEDELFKSMKVDFHPDGPVEPVMDWMMKNLDAYAAQTK